MHLSVLNLPVDIADAVAVAVAVSVDTENVPTRWRLAVDDDTILGELHTRSLLVAVLL